MRRLAYELRLVAATYFLELAVWITPAPEKAELAKALHGYLVATLPTLRTDQ